MGSGLGGAWMLHITIAGLIGVVGGGIAGSFALRKIQRAKRAFWARPPSFPTVRTGCRPRAMCGGDAEHRLSRRAFVTHHQGSAMLWMTGLLAVFSAGVAFAYHRWRLKGVAIFTAAVIAVDFIQGTITWMRPHEEAWSYRPWDGPATLRL
jgi:hypothetical protein